MISRMSTLFLRTLRDDPADAEVPSHKLLVRAGYVRRVGPGIYSWLPLGKRVLDNVARVVKEEMDRFGAQEVQFPALLPREYYEATGRWTEYGDGIFRLKDRKGADYLLGPTHEEMFTLMVKGEYSSYKDLPVNLYQIQTKYRDEARPRAGILRGREFLMKDSYSFDLDDEGLKRSYELHREAYVRIFDRLGLDYRIVSAMSGSMGGSASEEFLAATPTGEDTFVSCTDCDYAANTEAVEGRAGVALDASDEPALKVYDTPDTPTIDSLVELFNRLDLGRTVTAADTLKNVVVKLRHPGAKETEVLVVGVPGDREVDLKRLEAAVHPAEVELFEAEDFAKHPALVRGYLGPQGLAEAGYTYKVDPLVVPGSSWITGANENGKHAAHVVYGRDFTPDAAVGAAEVRSGDPCPRCGHALTIGRGIEIGHIFQLGRKFTNAFEFDVLGPDGKPVRVTMGSYGIGVSRAVAAIAEQKHDELGLVWPREVAPADVHLVATGKDDSVFEAAATLAVELDHAGVSVLFDDRRGVSPGVKFKDAELIGVPTIVVVGKGLAEGLVELRDRAGGERENVPLEQAAARLRELLG
ncbi:proline--tRNA ligase [Actinocrinis puniceicyclus]|uniref:Proline--tRNA ligase n=1 Tax=Actinocrinis puniceicyclus TaxID=977794 RepID=A0A8J7WID9_9ACTN|nr:proline--tRNA ligase [Actinocrinis puniceicyclus]MBS2962866.1 proline--tRNA ligase [Actinocrinis puniceicyclus]